MIPTALNKRSLLRKAGLALGTIASGCVASPSPAEENTDTTMKDTTQTDTRRTEWSTFQSDFARTGHDPVAHGPANPSKPAWSFDTGSPTVHCSPSIADGTVYTASSGTPGYLFAIDVETGEKQWRHDFESYATAAPTVTRNRVYVGERSGRVYALDRETGDEVWTADAGRPVGDSSPVVQDGTLFVGTLGAQPELVNSETDESDFAAPSVLALGVETGEQRWRYSNFSTRDSISTSVAFDGGLVYAGSEDGVVCALDAQSGNEQWRREVSGMIFSDVTVADGTVYFGEHDTGLLRAVAADTGRDRWTTELDGGNVKSSPAVTDDTVYAGCYASVDCIPEADDCDGGETGHLHAVRAADGEIEWTYETPHAVHSSPAVVENGVFLGRGNGVAGLRLDGEKRWSVEFSGMVESSPAVAEGRLVIGSADGNVYGIGESS